MAHGRRVAAHLTVRVVSLSPEWRDEVGVLLAKDIAFCAIDASDPGQMRAHLPDAHVLLTPTFDTAIAGFCRSLELIVCSAAGTDGIDRSAVGAGVSVVHSTGHEFPMAEYVFGALVTMRQQFLRSDNALRRGEWAYGYWGTRAQLDELYGSSLGIVGFGGIGAEVARRAAAFGMRCRAVTLHAEKPIAPGLLAQRPGALTDASAVDDLVKESENLVIACELSPLTRGLLDARRIGLMPRHAVLVNVARGPIVDERALYDALATKRIAGAAIDVWYHYPTSQPSTTMPSSMPFHELDNVLMTPHSSGWTLGHRRRKLAFFAATINGHAARRRLPGLM